MVNSNKKNMEGKTIYVQLAQSVQKSQINYTVASKQAYRPKKMFWVLVSYGCTFFKNTSEKKPLSLLIAGSNDLKIIF